jgi:hypothetical protein
MDIILLIGLICFSYLWAGKIDFLEDFKELIGFGENRTWRSTNLYVDYIYRFIHKLLNCYCIGFWLTWLLTSNIWLGFIVYVCAELLAKVNDLFDGTIKY